MKTIVSNSIKSILIVAIAFLTACSSPLSHPLERKTTISNPVGTDGVFQGIVEREVDFAMSALRPKRRFSGCSRS